MGLNIFILILYSLFIKLLVSLLFKIVFSILSIFSDKLNHASIYYGCLISRQKCFRYNHLDLNHLESQLKKTPSKIKKPQYSTLDNSLKVKAKLDNETTENVSRKKLKWLYKPIVELLGMDWNSNKDLDFVVYLHWGLNFIVLWTYLFYIAKCKIV